LVCGSLGTATFTLASRATGHDCGVGTWVSDLAFLWGTGLRVADVGATNS
jgi:hypothetical protein